MKTTCYDKWKELYQDQKFLDFNTDEALLWLKVRAISKKASMGSFLEKNKIKLTTTKIADQNKELYAQLLKKPKPSMKLLDSFLCDINNEWYRAKGVDEDKLKNDLYKVDSYEWGGDQNNSLDKYHISHYVKDISKYDELEGKLLAIQENAWKYVRTSWYNNWSSFLIESIFKHHPKVISAVGEIKSVDFFIDDMPLDLKVTYFPGNFMSEKLKVKLGGKHELAWLKMKAKEKGMGGMKEVKTVAVAMEKIAAAGHDDILSELRTKRKAVIEDALRNKSELKTGCI